MPKIIKSFCRLIYDESGIAIGEGKEALVAARLHKRKDALGLASLEDYLRYVTGGDSKAEAEITRLLDTILTNVTSFFREPDHFGFMADVIKKMADEGRDSIRIWSAGCSSGEEPLTAAMTFLENPAGFNSGDLEIQAIDLSTLALSMAARGEYNGYKARMNIPPQLLERYFTTADNGEHKAYKVKKELADMVTFSRLNLSKPPFPIEGQFDIIFCRYVMIFFDDRVIRRLTPEFERLLRPGGYLIIGHGESPLRWASAALKLVGTTVYERT